MNSNFNANIFADKYVYNKSIKELIFVLKKEMRQLKKLYKEVIFDKPSNDSEQILYDNYYILEKHYKMLCKEQKHYFLWTNKENYPLLGSIVLNLSDESHLPETDEIINAINSVSKTKYISNFEFELIIWQLRFLIILQIARIYQSKEFDKVNIMDYFALLTKSDTLDTAKITQFCNPLDVLYSKEICGVYKNMDEETKRIYRNYTSLISLKEGKTEIDTARHYIDLAKKAYKAGKTEKFTHIGYYIYKDYHKDYSNISPKQYISYIIFLTIILNVLFSTLIKNYWLWIFTFLPFYEISKVIVDIVFTSGHEITYLPRMDFKNTVPEGCETLINVSTLLGVPKDIVSLRKKLIRLHFSNLSPNIKICALCDLKQSNVPVMSEDKTIIYNAKQMIKELNRQYDNKFILIIRRRTYSKTQNVFTGYERKRGAIEQLIKFIKNENISFYSLCGDIDFIHKTKYIMALDYDTKALMDCVPQLVSIASHILNKPEIINNEVKSGYGIIAPKVTTKLNSSLKTRFSKFVGGIGSSSAYDNVCSNLYQDLFHEGIFSGKGLIDVDAFYQLCCDFFPEEKILSHDILEGSILHTGFAGDIELRDSFPSNTFNYFKRYHRWVRGDIQNAGFIRKKIPSTDKEINNPLSFINKYKLVDNIRRPLTPISIFILLLLSIIIKTKTALIISLFAIISLIFPYVVSFLYSIIYTGISSILRKYYSGVISQTKEIFFQQLLSILLLPYLVYTSADAIIRSIIRMKITHKNLLQWTTAAQTESGLTQKKSKLEFYILSEILSGILLFSNTIFTQVLGGIFLLCPIIIYFIDKPYKQVICNISALKANNLLSDLSSMWQLYEDYANENENYLPPDNIQFAPVYKVCHRTSPTNIGLMMISIIIARDFDFIDTNGLVLRIDRTLTSVEKLQKYKGNLFNWYETQTLNVCSNTFVSCVDSGNFLCCMVALKEGLKEYKNENPQIDQLIGRIEKIIDDTDLSTFYDKQKGLFSIGYNTKEDTLSPNHYDMLMSESRMTSYFAIAKRLVPKKHWRNLSRVMGKNGVYSGPVSYSGTMFEFFMPELFLISEKGSLTYEGLKFCVHCQKLHGKENNIPYGISESAYYGFDNALNYQYKAHGVQKIGLRNGLDKELVVSPYSSYLAMTYDFDAFYNNLEHLKKYGMQGNYGFYEAIDFTNSRCKKCGSIIKSYMAHHVGMSIVAISNVLQSNRIQKRFLRDDFMKSADELLEEKVISGAIIFDDVRKKPTYEKPVESELKNCYIEDILPSDVNMKLLCNGEYTLALADNGASFAMYQGKDVYMRTTDILRRPHGCFFAIESESTHLCMTYLPEYINSENMSVEISSESASYFSNTNSLQTGMRVRLHSTLPCEIRQFAIKNTSSKEMKVNLLCYIEPVLATYEEMIAHPAFCKLFLKENYDIDYKCIIISRKNRHSNDKMYCAIGFIENVDLSFNLSREQALSKPLGVINVFNDNKKFVKTFESIPDPCAMIKTPVTLSPSQQKELTLFILTGLSKDEIYQNIAKLRNERKISTLSSSSIFQNSIEGILVSTILPQILLKKKDCNEIINAIESNSLNVTSLWGLGISGDLPVVIVELNVLKNDERIIGYIKCHNILRLCGIQFDLVFIFDDKGEYSRNFSTLIMDEIISLHQQSEISTRGGIHLVDRANVDDDTINLLIAMSIHLAPQSMVRIGFASSTFTPIKINSMSKPKKQIDVQIIGGGFKEDSFIVNEETQLPWCHILANSVFGTLLSNSSLGFTYAINSRENKLTPWYNDTMTDNRGEMLLVKVGDKCYDVVLGSVAQFSEKLAVYYGKCDLFESIVTVKISDKGMCKKTSLELIWNSIPQNIEIAYYTEPVLGVTRDNSRMIKFSYISDTFICENPLNKEVSGYMSIKSSIKPRYHMTNRQDFLSGKWNQNSIKSQNNPCFALVNTRTAKKNEKINIEFSMSFGKTIDSALKAHDIFTPYFPSDINHIKINTPDKKLDSLFNYWIYWQALGGRVYARTGFYQNSGAYGFRDQLQDACGILLKNPEITKRQIARACCAQFIEGDVLHWWHKLPGNLMRGVRTRYSDDLVWLPYTVAEYVEKTSDITFISKKIAYCEGIVLEKGQKEFYGEVYKTDFKDTIYNHCKKALEKAYQLGEHQLILMGCGDWNDSFNNVGVKGKGESVWLSEFMAITFKKFARISELMNDNAARDEYLLKSHQLITAVEENCWDGEWYLRAFFDNGDELGSKNCEACQIDVLAQSFAILAGLPNKERNEIALLSAYTNLVDTKHNLIKLFTPAFNKNEMPVGYATSYPRGIRENGGQYTHGAIWLAIAMFEAGHYKKGNQLINILNPSNKYVNEVTANMYKNEPYYMSADIYTNPQCYGRAGWSIYTGAASWYYRAIFEWFLGLKIVNGKLFIKPNIPEEWSDYEVNLEYSKTNIHITVIKGITTGIYDNDVETDFIPIDGRNHEVRVVVEKNK